MQRIDTIRRLRRLYSGLLPVSKCLALVTLVCLLRMPVFALDDTQLMEETFFHRHYAYETPEQRLERLEAFIFGEPQVGLFQERYSRLIDTAARNKVSLDSAPVLDSVTDPRLGGQSNMTLADETPPVFPESLMPDATDYPLVTDMEQQLFRRPFAQEAIALRLERLENEVFKRTFTERSLAERVDQLTLRLIPNSTLAQEIQLQREYGQPQQLGPSFPSVIPSTGQQFAPSNLTIYTRLSELEQQQFGMSYGGETLEMRLNRLEGKLLGRVERGSIDARFDRLLERAAGPQRYGDPRFAHPPSSQQGASQGGTRMIGGWPPPDDLTSHQAYRPFTTPNPHRQYEDPTVKPLLGADSAPPDVLQQLTDLELDVFGRTFEAINMNNRLANLEIRALNETFTNWPLMERLSQLHARVGSLKRP